MVRVIGEVGAEGLLKGGVRIHRGSATILTWVILLTEQASWFMLVLIPVQIVGSKICERLVLGLQSAGQLVFCTSSGTGLDEVWPAIAGRRTRGVGVMDQVYMHNFRGFDDTLLPLNQINFLVGENSTGKSSFLKLVYMLSRPQFWLSPEASFQEEIELGGFDDIVSVRSSDRSYFQVGVLSSRKKGKRHLSCSFTVVTFRDREGSPDVTQFMQFSEDRLTKLRFQKGVTKYKIVRQSDSFTSLDSFVGFFKTTVRADRDDVRGFRNFPKEIPPAPPLPFAISLVNAIEAGTPLANMEFTAEIPFSLDLTWIAPIRTRPRRFYEGMRKAFTPEGDHTPFILRRSLREGQETSTFAEKLHVFGQESGLFQTMVPHSFDESPLSPFEILIRFPGADLNLINVGYGVSQVLPLLVEFLSRQENRTFAVQQPEVHLHPRAQAALGDLIAEAAAEWNHRFMLETHSDYLIDRCRLNISKRKRSVSAQTIFFQRTDAGNRAVVLPIGDDGKYPDAQPREFRSFFVREEMNLLEV